MTVELTSTEIAMIITALNVTKDMWLEAYRADYMKVHEEVSTLVDITTMEGLEKKFGELL